MQILVVSQVEEVGDVLYLVTKSQALSKSRKKPLDSIFSADCLESCHIVSNYEILILFDTS